MGWSISEMGSIRNIGEDMETYEVQELDKFAICIRTDYTQIHYTQFAVLIPYMDCLI
jgi:hypothetical protein